MFRGIDCELGEEMYDLIKQYQQDENEEQEARTKEAEKMAYEFGGNSFESGMMCAPALDLPFMRWYNENQDLDFTNLLKQWQRGWLTQQQREVA